MAAPIKRVLGWFDRNEWENVYSELYSGDLLLQKHAIDKIAVWKCRLLHKLSTAIEITWQLVSAQLLDKQIYREGGSHGQEADQQVRMAYGMALVRFVNLLTEKGQRGQYAQPIHILATELGLPEWLIEIRHDTTHANLPACPILRMGAKFALSYLQREYWEAQRREDDKDSAVPGTPSRPLTPVAQPLTPVVTEEDIADIICTYMEDKSYSQGKRSPSKLQLKSMRQALSALEKACTNDSEVVTLVLAQDGYMTPTREQLQLLGVKPEALNSKTGNLLPKEIVDFWKPAIKSLQSKNVIPALIETLLKAVDEETTLRNRFLVGWVIALITASCKNYEPNMSSAGSSLSAVIEKPLVLNGKVLLDMALARPNIYTHQLLKCLLPLRMPPLGKDEEKRLYDLVAVYTECPLVAEISEEKSGRQEDEVHYVNSLQERISNANDFCNKNVNITISSWTLDDSDVDWCRFPFGICPGQVSDYTSLELPTGVNNIQHAPTGVKDTARMSPVARPRQLTHKGEKAGIRDEDMQTEDSLGDVPPQWTENELQRIKDSINLF